MLLLFVCLIAGPIVAGRFIHNLPKIPMNLMQPTGVNNNDTTNLETGTGAAAGGGGPPAATGGGAVATAADGSLIPARRFL